MSHPNGRFNFFFFISIDRVIFDCVFPQRQLCYCVCAPCASEVYLPSD